MTAHKKTLATQIAPTMLALALGLTCVVGGAATAHADLAPIPDHVREQATPNCELADYQRDDNTCEVCDRGVGFAHTCADYMEDRGFQSVCEPDEIGGPSVYCKANEAATTDEAGASAGGTADVPAETTQPPAQRRGGCSSVPTSGGALALFGLVGAGLLRRRQRPA